MSADLLARVALSRVAEPGSCAVHQALQKQSPAAVWTALCDGAPLPGVGPQARAGLALRVQACEPERELEQLERAGGRVLCPGDPQWPDGLSWGSGQFQGSVGDMAPPFVLFARGPADLAAAAAGSVAIVGARAATAYGAHVSAELAFGLSEARVSVVSGGAYGIDGAAHRGALSAQAAPTVAVVACGVDLSYPRGNDRLFAQIADSGVIVSEVPPGTNVTRVRFLVRNRLVAALSKGVVVVEAALRSGSLSTASRGRELNRPVMCVPGPITSAQSAGCHEWLREKDAVLVTGVADVLEVVSASGEHLLAPRRGPEHPRDSLEVVARRVLDAVPVSRPIGVARVAAAAGVSALVVQQVLPALLLAGLVEQREGGWRLTTLGASR